MYAELNAIIHWFWPNVELVRLHDLRRYQDVVELADVFLFLTANQPHMTGMHNAVNLKQF